MSHTKEKLLLCTVLMTLGVGCKKAQPPQQPIPEGPVFGQDVWLPPPQPPEDPRVAALRELRETIEAFQQVKSFRAKLNIDTRDGVTTGQIDVQKPDRFHGTIRVPKEKQDGEVIGVGNSVYVKLPDVGWILVRSETLSKALGDAFRSAVDGDGSLIRKQLPDDTLVTKRTDTGRSCEAYRTKVKDSVGGDIELMVCVAGGLPKIIEATTPSGFVTVEYFDYNTLFTIERPTAIL